MTTNPPQHAELCALCDWTLSGGRKSASTHCLKCSRPICAFHSYPKYEGEIKTENFIGRICYLCLSSIETNPPPQQASDFDIIYNPDGTCDYHWDCGKTGVVLAYDVFSPESATWFCTDCWEEANEDTPADWLSIVEDKREKGGKG